MTRQLRIEYPGAFYHVRSRGNEKKPIFRDYNDRSVFFEVLETSIERSHWKLHAYCLMDNHYHLLLETPECRLSDGMQYLNGVYSQKFNHRYCRTGHLLTGRFDSTLVLNDPYVMELARYIVLNPVRAGLCKRTEDWTWSSYRQTAGMEAGRSFVCTDFILGLIGENWKDPFQAYVNFVAQGLFPKASSF
jgi:REP element-mobilizing transposase RayT